MKLKIRINELARELEVKPNRILDLLPELGVQEKKTHSSSIDEDVAIAIKRMFGHEASASDRRAHDDEDGGVAVAVEEEPTGIERGEDRGAYEPRERRAAPETASEGAPEPADTETTASSGRDDSADQRDAAAQEVKRAAPLRPPLSSRVPIRPPVGAPLSRPSQPAPPAQAQQPRPPEAEQQTAPPPAPSRPAPQQPQPAARPQMPAPQQPRPAGPGAPQQGKVIPGRDVPLYRPGQVISGPRQPLPPPAFSGEQRPPMDARTSPIAPGPPRPAPTPGAPRPPQAPQQQRPGGPSMPGPRQPGPQVQRPNVVGRPAARPVVPPNPELIERIRQSRPAPGAPGPAAPRPGMPQQRPASPIPGQPIYGRPGVRPGQPSTMRGPGGPGARTGPPGRRPMHPTTPLRPESAAPVPTEGQRRLQAKGRPNVTPEERKRDAEGKLRSPEPRFKSQPLPVVNKEITIGEGITAKELAEKLGVKSSLLIKQLFDRKIFATINQTLDVKLAQDLARDFGATTSTLSFEEEENWEVEMSESADDRELRAPVVTVMGHVDHGKTSLLDAIRSTNVADREAGGITQHIGASVVEHNGNRIVFIDTPGHEAFTRMRARGAKVTDIVILVVSADDGVMPQTIEAIDHARAAKVPIVVAINKIDKPDAQPDRIKQQLSDRGLLAEDWGGDVVMVPVSAKTGQNIDLLLEMLLLVTEMQNLRANRNRPAVGSVLEAQLDRGRGPVATVLVQNGVLKVGDFFICGSVFGKVRAMYDHLGAQVREAGPSTPVEVLGLADLPDVGDQFQVVTDTAKAKQIVMYREVKAREQQMSKGARVTLEQFQKQAREGDVKELNIILKTDVGGTAEVLSEMLQKLSTEKVRVRVIARNVGAITESDVLLAAASSAIVIGFNVRPERNAEKLAEKEGIDIRLHTIIYELTDEIKKAMTGMLEPVYREAFRGRADVREVFSISKVGAVAGCYITEGTFTRDCQVRVLRDNIVVHTGRVESLRRFKNDVAEVRQGFECGIVVANFGDIKQGDILEAFVMEKVAAELG